MLTATIEYVGKTTAKLSRATPSVTLPVPVGTRYGDTIITVFGGSALYRVPVLMVPELLQLSPIVQNNTGFSNYLVAQMATGYVGDLNTVGYTYRIDDTVPATIHVVQLIYRGVDATQVEGILRPLAATLPNFTFPALGVPVTGDRAMIVSGLVTPSKSDLQFGSELGTQIVEASPDGMFLVQQIHYRTGITPDVQMRTNANTLGLTFTLRLPGKFYSYSQLVRIKNVSDQLQVVLLNDSTASHLFPQETRDIPAYNLSDDLRRAIGLGLLKAYTPETGAEIL